MKKEPAKEKKLKIDTIKKLQGIKLPNGWEIAKLEVQFVKRNHSVPIQSNYVVYDGRNDCFYAKTARGYIYPEEIKNTYECIKIMQEANKIIKSI